MSTQRKLLTALVGVLAIVSLAITGAAAVEVYNDTVEVDNGDTVTVDVEVTDEFINDSLTNTTVDVALENDTGTVVNSSSITVEDTAFGGTYSGESIWRTAEFEPAANGTYTVTVNADAETYVNTTEATVGSGGLFGGGIIAGAGQTELLGFAIVVGGLAYAYREDWL